MWYRSTGLPRRGDRPSCSSPRATNELPFPSGPVRWMCPLGRSSIACQIGSRRWAGVLAVEVAEDLLDPLDRVAGVPGGAFPDEVGREQIRQLAGLVPVEMIVG